MIDIWLVPFDRGVERREFLVRGMRVSHLARRPTQWLLLLSAPPEDCWLITNPDNALGADWLIEFGQDHRTQRGTIDHRSGRNLVTGVIGHVLGHAHAHATPRHTRAATRAGRASRKQYGDEHNEERL